MGYNPSKSTWLNPNIEYIFNTDIIEYDIKDAGFTLIKQYKLLPETKIRELEGMGKGVERHIAVGNLQREDKEFSNMLLKKFAEIRAVFIAENKLTDDNIISVKKDAIYTIGRCKKTRFDLIAFDDKNHYTSYIRFARINNMELYYSFDGIDIKGMSDSAVNRHRLFMLSFLNSVIPYIESHDVRSRKFIMNFINEYKGSILDREYYVEFNSRSSDFNPLYNYQNVIIPLLQIIRKELD